MFKKKKPEVLVVEVSPHTRVPQLDADSRAAVTSLADHPGFRYLMEKLKFEKAVLESRLKNEKHSEIRDVEALQAGIFWAGWLEEQVSRETKISKIPVSRRLNPEEDAAFQHAMTAYEVITPSQD